jgi:hypothetical protein
MKIIKYLLGIFFAINGLVSGIIIGYFVSEFIYRETIPLFSTPNYFFPLIALLFLITGLILGWWYGYKTADIKNIKSFLIIGATILLIAAFFINDASCEKNKEGWSCTYKLGLAIPIYQESCEKQGGIWNCSGFCLSSYSHYCDFSLGDAGKECINSSECESKCVISTETAETRCSRPEGSYSFECKDIRGECSKYRLRTCDSYFELNNGTVNYNMVICD